MGRSSRSIIRVLVLALGFAAVTLAQQNAPPAGGEAATAPQARRSGSTATSAGGRHCRSAESKDQAGGGGCDRARSQRSSGCRSKG